MTITILTVEHDDEDNDYDLDYLTEAIEQGGGFVRSTTVEP